jgi:nucleotide-binding universal stress UspA family protein
MTAGETHRAWRERAAANGNRGRSRNRPLSPSAPDIGQNPAMTDERGAMILLCYDGSDDSQAAAERVAKLFPGAHVSVLTVWEPYIEIVTQGGFGAGFAYAPPITDLEQIDATIEEHGRATAEEGADQLGLAGLTAHARTEARGTSVAATILEVADEIDANAIILGTRGRGGVKSLLLGSVSHAVVQHADRPVLVIPSAAVAQARHDRRY